MKPQVKATFLEGPRHSNIPTMDPKLGVLVVDGYGIRIAVERGHLTVSDGAGRERRERRLARVGHGIRRLIIIGHTGTISLDALRWLDRTGIHFSHIDTDGTLLTASTNESAGNARLRRAQVLAFDTPARLAIVTTLLDAKIAGQARNTRTYLNNQTAAERIDQHRNQLRSTTTVEEAREIESTAALDYFGAWRNNVSLRWATRDQDRIPDHWRTFTGRRSQIAKSTNARASDPINAILNYLYHLGEIECRRACLILGLDPGLGYLHHDTQTRDSLALDLIEAIRPHIDAHLLQLADTHIFTTRDFHETDDGNCRILPPLTHQLATTLPAWEAAVAPWAEQVAHTIADTSPYRIPKTKPLSGAIRSATATTHQSDKRKGVAPVSTPRPDTPAALRSKQCQHCGSPLSSHGRTYCGDCWPMYREAGRQRAVHNAASALADPKYRTAKRQAISKGRLNSIERAITEQGHTPEHWDQLAPRVAKLTLQQIMDATGYAVTHASRIKSGNHRPHPKHWTTLEIATT